MTAPEERVVNEELVKYYAKRKLTYPPAAGSCDAPSQMSATPTAEELERVVGSEGSVDLVTVSAAVHWLDLGKLYPVVKCVLRTPGGVFAAWTYFSDKVKVCAEFDEELDQWFETVRVYRLPVHTHDALANLYKDLPFPFDPVSGVEAGKGVEGNPEEIMMEKQMNFHDEVIFHCSDGSEAGSRSLKRGRERGLIKRLGIGCDTHNHLSDLPPHEKSLLGPLIDRAQGSSNHLM